MYEAVGMNNHITISGRKKRLVCNFRTHEFWECIGCVLLAVTYGKKVHKLWSENPKSFGNKESNKI